MRISHWKSAVGSLLLLAALAGPARATETENLNIRILPTPGAMAIDGKVADWDLSGGVFVCGDVENLREQLSVWVHAMYDADNLYVLARFRDPTPMSNPGLAGADMPWAGDSLQLRIIADLERKIAHEGRKKPAVCWVNGWHDREGKDAIDIDFPYSGGKKLANAITAGARQACTVAPDKRGYVQEMALPWKLLSDHGIVPKAGDRINFSVEPNFNTSSGFRISLKGIFRPGVVPDRVFTFSNYKCWGYGVLAPKGPVEPQKLKLADKREFAVRMEDGAPVVDWTGLFEAKQIEGFAEIALEMPEDGYVSLNIKNADGQVVRQLLTANFLTKGKHELLWDGLTNMSHLRPGEVVEPGAYTWEAIYHTGIGLRLVGWADNAGKTPFDSPGGNWGGDHGHPCSVTSDGKQMVLGWSGSEAGKAVVCTDFDGKVKWRHKRGGFGGATAIAAADGSVYVNDNQLNESVLYRLDATKGEYRNWKGKDSAVLPIASPLAGLDIAGGKLYLSRGDGIQVLDAETGVEVAKFAIDEPGDLEATRDGAVYVISRGTRLLRLDDQAATPVIEGLKAAQALAIGPDGALYIAVGDPDNQVQVYSPEGKLLRSIGKAGGRPLFGPWQPDGMRFVSGLRVDAKGLLWVAEKDGAPKRFSCWNTVDGTFFREFFGPTAYGATGGAISPDDPLTMVGSGCEWRLDAETVKSHVVGVFHRQGIHTSRFGRSPEGRLYVAVNRGWDGFHPVFIYERVGAGDYKLRCRFDAITDRKGPGGRPEGTISGVRIWSDVNDDQQEQPGEVRDYDIELGMWLAGWYMPMTPTMIFYGGDYRIAPTGWTACGAPLYDLSQAARLPAPDESGGRRGVGMGVSRSCGSADGRIVVYNGSYGKPHSDFPCYDIETGTLLWSYPNNYVGVHGGHRAPPPQVGMIRAAYDIVGTGRLPDPIGDIFVIGTDKGEWHILTGEGYYLTSLFEADPLKIRWPDPCVPGAIMDNVPPGMGAEDFGGSMTVGKDGQLYIQAGKTAYINIKAVGLDSVRKLPGGKLPVAQGDLAKATAFREKLLQASIGAKMVTAKKTTVTFTGDLKKDFATNDLLTFQKTKADRVEAAIAWDDARLYLAWQVNDATPWVNGASEAAQMYAMGDTVDFQLGANPTADPKRREAVAGDLRLSIGNLQGTPTAVLYEPISARKNPRTFVSGVVRDGWTVQNVQVLDEAEIKVTIDERRKQYTVEARAPLAALDWTPEPGKTYTGDIGVTFSDPTGKDTVLRSYWNNQATGLVADEVFELQLQPANWGRLTFEPGQR
jgi:hypothetical protein